ncbi:hypothetical protein FGKAn22_14090 [Ferrigenium kumadai]|uniref:Plastocyanin-like domain-containing protein n=1 Tax=Ferrigenium kumadai TaxID=1682490 RepID=A0AAN1T020_9PROT|nr:hypothetical protein FGKAn22_14090 [Ferrigenium kumadai]
MPTGEYGNETIVAEAFMDTPVVNGTAYPTVKVLPKAYRFRILNATNDRSLNLGLYEAEPLTIEVTAGGAGYSATPAVTITPAVGDVTGAGATASAVVTAGVVSKIIVTNPGTGYTAAPTIKITDATGTGAAAVASVSTEVKMVPAVPNAAWPAIWPTDGRAGGVPDPSTAGPDIVQVGSEGGFLPAPAVIPSTPIGYEFNRRSVTVLNVLTYGLYLAPAERADAVIDFSGYCPGTKLILYNDAPAPVPGFDPRADYYTGNPDLTAVGGAPSTLPGYGPNTRTIMRFEISGAPVPGCVRAAFTQSANPNTKNPKLTALQTAWPAAYAATQPKPVVGEAAYNGLWPTTFTNSYASIHTGSIRAPNFTFTNGDGLAQTLPVQNKAIQELFDPNYGRMNATLGVELPFTSAFNQTTIPLGYVDPATETIADGETQIWKITHNGVDTHPVHFHLVNVQLINRVGWDGTIKPPAENELGWKETVKMNPLEDVIVAVRSKAPTLPFGLSESIRALDPTQPLGTTGGLSQVNPTTGLPATITNAVANFGWEYVWHCHILGHEENDFMRPIVFKYTAVAPLAPTNASLNAGVLNWTDPTPANAVATMGDQQNEIGFRIERSANYGAFTQIGTTLANATSFVDTTPKLPLTDYSYRVIAYNAAGSSAPSNIVTQVQQAGGLTPGSLAFASLPIGTVSLPQTLSLTNATAAAVTIQGRTISGVNAADYAETDNCGTSLAAAATCTINVTFTPKTSGSSIAMLTVATSAGSKTAALSGASPVPSAKITPATPLAFPAQQVGTAGAVMTATLTNTGSGPLAISGVTISGTNAADFSQINTCGTSLPAGVAGSCTISVSFNPSLVSLETATLNVVTDAGTQKVTLNGQGVAPAVTLNPTAPLQLAFAAQQVGTVSAPSIATLTNTGSGPVTITSVTITGLNQIDFAQTNNCPIVTTTLAAGASCTINVTFKPTATTPRTATLNVATTAGTPTVALAGGGQSPSSALTPTIPLTYPTQQVATTSVAQAATLTNNGVGPLAYTGVTITGTHATDFAQTNNCATGLAVGAKCAINVTFTPTAVGARTATLNVVDASGTKMLTLNGTGQAANSATVSAAALSYTAQQTGTASVAQPVTLTNTGALALPITSISITGLNATDFAQTNNCGLSLAAGTTGTCAINVTFNPAAAGAKSAALTIVNAAGTQIVALGGTGQAPSSTLAPVTAMAFGTLQSGSPATVAQVATLTNTGVGPLSVTSIAITGANAAEFAQTNNCGVLPASLPVGATGTCTINVTFTPGAAGAKSATLTVTDASGAKTIPLTATSQATSSVLSPTIPLSFLAQQAGTSSAAQVATLTNTGVGPLSISSIAISGANATEFAQTNNCGTLPASLPTGATGTCTINVTFNPATSGPKSATLTVVDGVGTQTIALNGTGALQLNSFTPTTPMVFASQQTGTASAAQVATLANSGIIPLTVTSIAISGANAADFTQTNNCGTLPASLPVGITGTCSINVAFTPTTAGTKSATLTVVDGAATHTIALSGTGTTQSASLTPATPLVFASQQTGTASAAQVATLTNSGIGPLAVTSITFTGANAADFAQTNNCGTSLAVGAAGTCTINVTFNPTTAGAKSATLSVVDGAGTHTVAVSGTGQAPSASLTPATSLAFAVQQTGSTSAAQPVVVTNTGVGPLSIAGITIGGTNYLNFTQTSNCGTSLAVGASCTINVSFAPTAVGAMTATLNVADGAGVHMLALNGTGAVQSASLTPATPLAFAAQQTGTTSAAQVATLTNSSTLPLAVTSIAITGVDAADFAQNNNCGTSVAAGATGSCTISVTFKPAIAGAKSATLTVVDGAGTHTVALTGTGQAASASLTPATPLTFAAQQTGTTSAAQAVVVANTGVGPLSITGITIGGTNYLNFTQTNNCGTSLAVGASCTVNVSFAPTAAGTMTATLNVADGAGVHMVALNGTGAVQSASLTPATPLTFALQQTGTTSAAQVVTLTNTSVLPLSVTSVAISGVDAADFAQTNNCGTSVAAGTTGSCKINVTFAPGTIGTKTAVLTVVDGAGTHSINLNGTGSVQTASLTPATPLTFAAQQTGTASAALVATLTNTGSLPLSVSSITLTGANAADFAQTNNCGTLPTSLAAGATGSCSISVTFNPATVGAKTATLSVVDGAGTHTVALNGTGAVQANSLTPTTPMAFGMQQTGTTSAVQVATLTNSGIIPLSVTSIAISGVNAADFAQTSNCGTSLPVGATGVCTINVTFTPATVGTKSATLTVVDGAGTHTIALSGTGAVPAASLTPTVPLTFAAQQTGTSSAAQVATLTNNGIMPLSVTSIAITGANAVDFTQTNNCGTSLAAAASCTINVTLAPGTAGAKIASLTVVDGAGTHTLSLTGTGQTASANLTPATPLTFAVQQIGSTSAAQVATLTNTGVGPLSVTSIAISGLDAGDFTQTNNCGALPASLAAGASGSCTINVTFKPTTVGAKTATLTVVDGAGTHTVALSGSGAVPQGSLTPTTRMAFAEQQTGTASAAQVATLSNTGFLPLAVTSITISGTNAAEFAQTNNCGTSLAVGTSGTCTINVTFVPTSTGAKSAMLTVVDGGGSHTVALSGTGAVQSASLTPATPLTFALQQTGTTSAAQVATLSNTGVIPLSVTSIAITGANAADFAQTNNCGTSVASGATGSCTINVTFAPTTIGAKTATLTVVDGAGTHTVTLNGAGDVLLASLTPATPLTFAVQQTGTGSAAQVATLTNTGKLPLSVTSITFTGANAADFAQTNNCGTSLAVGTGGTCTINVTFNPATAGAKSATLSVVDGAGTHTVSVSGTGQAPSASLTPATQLAFAVQQTGTTSAAQPVVVTNTGVGPLSIAGITIGGTNYLNFTQTSNCGTSLPVGASCTINVSFAPIAAGAMTATLNVADGAGVQMLALNGTGGVQSASLTPATPLVFAAQQTGTTSAAQVATLTNSSTLPLSVSSIAITGVDAADFAQNNNCGTSVAAGATGSCTISVTFKPAIAGAKSATLTVVDGAGTHTVALTGTGQAASASLTPATPLTFAAQQTGTTSAAQAVVVANTGVGPLSITGITIGGTNYLNFTQTNNCGTSLAVGASCTVNVSFAPTAAGTMTATLNVADGAGVHMVALNGTGAVQSASLTPATPLTFALQQTGTTSAAQVVTLTNTSVLPLSVTSVAISGVDAADFAQTNNCGTSVAAGTTGSCKINVTFAPGTIGTKTAVLTVVDGAGTHSINLNGTGSVQTASLTPATPLTFAAQQTGTASAALVATLTNTGSLPLSVSSITLTGANAADFAQTNNCGTLPTSLAAGATGSCSISVTFNPATVGAKTAALTVVDGMGTHTVALNGTGAVQANSLTPTTPMAFGLQQTGTTSAMQVATLTNSGIIPLSVTSIAISGPDAADFTQTNNCGTSLPVGATGVCTINVTFTPATVGTKSATLTVVDGAGIHTVVLSGTGAVQLASLTPATPLVFAAQQTGTISAAQVATLTNSGTIPLSVSGITIGGVNAADFIQTNNCGASLAPAASCTINVTLAPGSVGAKSATLSLVDGAGTQVVALNGTGAVQSASLTPSTPLTFAAQQTGTTSAALVATLTNSAIIPLSITSIAISGVNAAEFVQTNNCGTLPANLPVGQTGTCTINVTFVPATSGAKSATLTVVDGAGTHTVALNGTGAAPSASLTPATALTFAAQQTGTTSTAHAVVVANTGVGPLSIAGITIGGTNYLNFTQTSNCGTSLAVGASCTINVSFAPTAVGSMTATLNVADGAGAHMLALNGTGAVQSGSFTPATPLTFAAKQTGTTSAAQVATLTNTGVLPLAVTSISITGANAAEFAQTNNCGTSVAAGATGSCTINVTFTPVTVGAKSATLTVVDGAGTRTTALTGMAVAQAAMLTPGASLMFASQQVMSTSSVQAVTLTNTGAGPLPIARITIGTSGGFNQFAQTNNCGASLAEGASCTIGVTFAPSTMGTKAETLMVWHAGGMQTLMLRGTAAAPVSSLTPDVPTSFGNQLVGTSSGVVPLTLTNNGVIPLSITSIAIESWGQLNQFGQTNTCGASLAAGANCVIYVSFMPSSAGFKLATLIINDAAGGHAVALNGTGVTTPTASTTTAAPLAAQQVAVTLIVPTSSLTPATPFAFAAQAVGAASAPQVATLANTGATPLSVTSISISGVNAADFAQTNTCGVLPASLPIGTAGTCSIDVIFTPKTAGTKNATLTVVDGGGTHTITLSGTGQ